MSSREKSRVFLRLEQLEDRLAPAIFDVNSASGLQSAIQAADGNSDASNTINLAAGTYTLSAGVELLIQDQPDTARTLSLVGAAENTTILTGGSKATNRIFEIIGNSNLTVRIQNLTITGGNVVGATGSAGAAGVSGQNGGAGGKGGEAEGGGIYLASGSLTLTNVTVRGNSVSGGKGGAGGAGGNQLTHYAPTPSAHLTGQKGAVGKDATAPGGEGGDGGDGGDGQDGPQAASLKNGAGGDGGDGGDAKGGGIYVASGQLTLINTTVLNNAARGARVATAADPATTSRAPPVCWCPRTADSRGARAARAAPAARVAEP